MALEIKSIRTKAEWDKLINRLSPHTFLQSWEWTAFQESLGNKIFRLGLYENGELLTVFFVYKISAKRGSFLLCPHGPLVDWRNDEQLRVFVDYIIKLGKKEDVNFIRFCPLEINGEQPCRMLKTLGFIKAPLHLHPEHAWLLDLGITEDELLKKMEKRTRYSIRKAQKDGVEIIKSKNPDDLSRFYEIYQETANRQIFVPFNKEYLTEEYKAFSTGNKAMIIFAKFDGEFIAAAYIIFANGSAFYHHGASLRKYSKIPAAELVQWEAIKEAKNLGCGFYNFWGIAPPNSKNHPWAGLTKFKIGFGGFAENYICAQDLKLNNKYWFNYLIEKVRKIKRGY